MRAVGLGQSRMFSESSRVRAEQDVQLGQSTMFSESSRVRAEQDVQ